MGRRSHSGIFCPHCEVEQAWSDISFVNWFVCHGCGTGLHVDEKRGERSAWIAAAGSLLLVLFLQKGFVFSILLWIAVTPLLTGVLLILWMEFSPPPLRTDLPGTPPPGSLGLN
jgi:hypothetical protein